MALGRLHARTSPTRSSTAADEVLAGELRDQFVVDVYQAGAGTSHNMNANEVLANRAAELLGERARRPTRACTRTTTSTWDSPPTTCSRPPRGWRCCSTHRGAGRVGSRAGRRARRARRATFADVLKVGRTHLQDAVPMTLGQEFGGYAACVARGADDVEQAAAQLLELNLGATAVGTGLNAGDDYTRLAVAALARDTGSAVVPAANRFRVTQSMGDVLAVSGAMRRLAVEAGKVASDLRLLAHGPARRASRRCGCRRCSQARRSCRAR